MTTPEPPGDLPGEFALIARHFRPLAGPGALDLTDDAAVLPPPPGRELVAAADAMVEGVHWLAGECPNLLGRKLLRVNLSDLAAMGAEPLGYLLTIALPRGTPDDWLAGFTTGLGDDQRRFGLHLLGGDTTSTPGPICLSLTILGSVAPGQAVRRAGARPGDGVWVTGTIGDGILGLAALRGEVSDPGGALAGRYRLPEPRLALKIGGLASACADVSDGLVQDLGHLCRAGGLAAEIVADAVPLSRAARAVVEADPAWLPRCLAGGDDYELVMAVPPAREAALEALAKAAQVPATRIGRFVPGAPAVTVHRADGTVLELPSGGWSHF